MAITKKSPNRGWRKLHTLVGEKRKRAQRKSTFNALHSCKIRAFSRPRLAQRLNPSLSSMPSAAACLPS
eukprot:2088157-Amphidinium_carterae.1